MSTATHDTSSNLLSRFLLQRSGLRGVLVQLGEAWKTVQSRGDYPAALRDLLGEILAAAPLFTGHVKVDGRLSIQMRGEGSIRTLFAECTAAGTLRGLARWQAPLPEPLDPSHFGTDAMMVITIEGEPRPGREPQRYQGLVGLQADRIASAFEDYFTQSEQLPTRILLAADGDHACGIMLQHLPGASDDPEAWRRAHALLDTLTRDELLTLPAETLLYRLFHEEQVALVAQKPLQFGCSCSRQRVGTMLLGLGRSECDAALSDSRIEVICEFCGHHYHFDALDVEQLFAGGGSTTGSGTLQ